MEHLHVWFITGAYLVSLALLACDAILPRIRFHSLLRGILLRERRNQQATARSKP